MKTGTAVILIFAFFIGAKLESDKKTAETHRTEVTASGYSACVDNLYVPNALDTQETKDNWMNARRVCANVWFGQKIN